jgi:hypothetical protein
MNTYLVAPEENGFQVIETYPDGRERYHSGFVTRDVASEWLTNHLSLMNMADLARWVRER